MKRFIAALCCCVMLLGVCACTAETETPEKEPEKDAAVWSVSFRGKDVSAVLTDEDSLLVSDILSGTWEESLTDCGFDVIFTDENGNKILYSSDCGTFNNNAEKLRLELSSTAQKSSFNNMLENYGTLGIEAIED